MATMTITNNTMSSVSVLIPPLAASACTGVTTAAVGVAITVDRIVGDGNSVGAMVVVGAGVDVGAAAS